MATEEVIYTVVGWEQLPLAHYSSYAGTFRAFVEEAARHIDIPTAPRLSHKYGEFVLHSLVNEREPRVTFTCLTGDKFPQPLAYAYLAAVRREFFRRYPLPMDKNTTLRFELNGFSQQIRRLVRKYRESKNIKRMKEEEFKGEAIEPVAMIKLDELYPGLLKKPLMVRHLQDPSLQLRGASRKSNNFFLSQFLIRHPFLTIGLFIFAAVVVFIYFVVLVPLCGNDLQKVGDNGKHVCWIN